jgi:hypothetical protein
MYITKLVNEHQDLMKYDIIKSILSDVKIIDPKFPQSRYFKMQIWELCKV